MGKLLTKFRLAIERKLSANLHHPGKKDQRSCTGPILDDRLLRWRLAVGRKLFRKSCPSWKTVRVSLSRVIKGPVERAEIDAMLLVAKHTTVPIPKVFRIYQAKGEKYYFEMEYVWGEPLSYAWFRLSQKEKETMVKSLASCIQQLRNMSSDTNVVSGPQSATQSFSDWRIGNRQYGPFQTHDEFHSLLRAGLALSSEDVAFTPEIKWCHQNRYVSKFTHGDFVMHNIMVRHGKLAAVIDWECAGWFPEYWEYTKAHYALYIEDYYDLLEEELPRYDRELQAERQLWNMVPEPGYDLGSDNSQ